MLSKIKLLENFELAYQLRAKETLFVPSLLTDKAHVDTEKIAKAFASEQLWKNTFFYRYVLATDKPYSSTSSIESIASSVC